MELIDKKLLDRVSREASESPRLRMNYNFHKSLNDKAQRLLNALEVGTVVPIHRHMHTSETYVLLRGKIRVTFYDNNKTVVTTTILDTDEGKYGVNIPVGQWHTLEVLGKGTVIFEVKDGPYTPLKEEDILF